MIIPRCDALSDKEKPGDTKPPGHRIPLKYISMNARSLDCAGVRAWLCLFFNFTNIACAIRDVKHILGKSAFFDEDDLCARFVTVQTCCSYSPFPAAKYPSS